MPDDNKPEQTPKPLPSIRTADMPAPRRDRTRSE